MGKETRAKNNEVKREEERQWARIKNEFLPFLVENSKSITDAEQIVAASGAALQNGFDVRLMEYQTEQSKKPVSDLKLEKLVMKNNNNEISRNFLKFFNDEPVAKAKSLLTNTAETVNALKRSEMLTRTLDTLDFKKLE